MGNLLNIKFKRTYSSLQQNLTKDLINPLLSESISYDRAVGFFSSSWLKEVAGGLSIFAQNGGKARIVTSIKLSNDDWVAIQDGTNEHIQTIIDKQVFETIQELQRALETETLTTLSWLIAHNILEIRFAIPIGKLKGGIFHTKLSLFYDSYGNGVAVFGSQNDSHQATLNEESLNIFTNWDFGQEYFYDHKKDFEEKWDGNSQTLRTFNISEASRIKIIDAGGNYPFPYINKDLDNEFNRTSITEISKKLRNYQEKAIENWIDNNYQGIFEMATGSGKTFTSISAASILYNENNNLCLVILVPYKHLVTQWENEIKKFGFKPILCFEDREKWENLAYKELNKYKAKLTDKICFIATHATACLEPFQNFIKTVDCDWMLIADEVHSLGSKNQSNALFPTAIYRIGLSATPKRWFDEYGTKRLFDYFKKTVIEYDLESAIQDEALTPYEYQPILIEFNADELEKYKTLSNTIRNFAIKEIKTEQEKAIFDNLCRQRAKLIGKAESKIPELINLAIKHKEELEKKGEKYCHNLYYCTSGEHKEVLSALSSKGIKVHEFVSYVKIKEREEIIAAFTRGDIDGLVAIKCLDEGVDIPATKRAYILASSTNPREFVQRRGRILRKSGGKDRAYIYDFIVGPWSPEKYNTDTGQQLLRRELPRFSEFNSLNLKKYESIKEIRFACEYFNMLNEIDMKPWEIYDKIIKNFSDLLI